MVAEVGPGEDKGIGVEGIGDGGAVVAPVGKEKGIRVEGIGAVGDGIPSVAIACGSAHALSMPANSRSSRVRQQRWRHIP